MTNSQLPILNRNVRHPKALLRLKKSPKNVKCARGVFPQFLFSSIAPAWVMLAKCLDG
jgi:hypothetical protein